MKLIQLLDKHREEIGLIGFPAAKMNTAEAVVLIKRAFQISEELENVSEGDKEFTDLWHQANTAFPDYLLEEPGIDVFDQACEFLETVGMERIFIERVIIV